MGHGVTTERGKAVVEGVRRCAVDVVSTNAGEVDVGLDNGVQGRRHHVLLARGKRLGAVVAQRLVAELGERHAGTRDARALEAGRLGADGCAALEVGAQGVTHAGDQEAHRGVCDDLGINHDGIGVGGIEEVLVKAAVVVVDDRETRAGRVGGCDGGDDHHVLAGIVGRGLGGVDGRAATHGHHGIDAVLLDDCLHLGNLALARDAAKDLVATVVACVAKALLKLVMAGLVAALRAHEEPALAHIAHLVLELEQGTLALDVLQGLTHCTQQLHGGSLLSLRPWPSPRHTQLTVFPSCQPEIGHRHRKRNFPVAARFKQ